MKYVLMVLGTKHRVAEIFDSEGEPRNRAKKIVAEHPEINVFVAPLVDPSQLFNYGAFND